MPPVGLDRQKEDGASNTRRVPYWGPCYKGILLDPHIKHIGGECQSREQSPEPRLVGVCTCAAGTAASEGFCVLCVPFTII